MMDIYHGNYWNGSVSWILGYSIFNESYIKRIAILRIYCIPITLHIIAGHNRINHNDDNDV
jgi:hypothetical protein